MTWKVSQLTDGEIRRELADTPQDSQRYADLMAELEERMLFRNSMRTTVPGWHRFTDICEGS